MDARILLVANDDTARERLKKLLLDLGCRVAAVPGRDEALAMLRGDPPQLILVDLPAADAQALRRVQEAELPTLPFLAVGAESEIDADGHVERPIDAFVLHDRMARLLLMSSLPADFYQTQTEADEDLSAFLRQSLRTMVAGLPGLVDAVRGQQPNSPEIEALLQEALKSGARVGSYASYLESFAVGDGRPHPVDLHDILESVIADWLPMIRQRATIQTRLTEVPKVMAREEFLKQVFSGLVLNAAQAITPGDPEKNRIEVVAYTYANNWAVVEVSDTGSGIPAELQTKIFEPYFSTKRGLGMGLGLFVSRNIITALGGRIGVESQLGRGSTFKISLPPAVTK
jgi:signal transduction histidine kinase